MTLKTFRIVPAVVVAIGFFSFTIHSGSVSGLAEPPRESGYDQFDSLLTDLSAYAWPVDTALSTTSVFADFRATHFHAGVDVSTRGRVGYDVRAMRDGYISLVRVSPNGYGKAIEVTHKDGFTTWYAHLSRYAPAVDSAVRRLQVRRGMYPVTLRPKRSDFPVKQGDLIAFTGSSGAGGAHVHFEIRDQNGNPLNPLLSDAFVGLAEDDVAPVVEEVGFIPLASLTFIEGDSRPIYLRPVQKLRHEYTLRSVHTTGLLGVSVKVRDGVGRRAFRNRGVTLRFEVDDNVVFESAISRIPSNEGKQIALHYDWAARGDGRSHHQKLFLETGNRLPFYNRLPAGSGMLNSESFERGSHRYTITASDIHGNTTVVHGELVFNHPPVVDVEAGRTFIRVRSNDPTVRSILRMTADDQGEVTSTESFEEWMNQDDGSKLWYVPYPDSTYTALNVVGVNDLGTRSANSWIPADRRSRSNSSLTVETSFQRSFAYVSVSSSLPITGRPRIKVYSGAYEADLSVRSASPRRFFSSFSLDLFDERPIKVEALAEINGAPDVVGFDAFTIYPITRERGGVVHSADGAFRLVFPPGGVFEPVYVRLEKEREGFDVQPDDVVLDRGASVEMEVPERYKGKRVGLFSVGGSSMDLLDWRGPDGVEPLRGRVSRFLGTFEVLVDETGPSVRRVSASYRWGQLSGSFRISDDLAGVNASSIRTTIDGRTIIPEYETETKRVVFSETMKLKKGAHTLVIEARDNMRNATRTIHNFRTK